MASKRAALEVLIVEDSETDTKLVMHELRSSGFAPAWERVETPETLREALVRKDWQIVLSDSSVPRLGPLEALAVARELAPEVPFIVVSGSIDEEMAVAALRAGAADYVTKERLGRLGPAVARELAASPRPGAPFSPRTDDERRAAAHELHDQFERLLVALKLTLDSVSMRRGAGRAKGLAEARSLVDEAILQSGDVEGNRLWKGSASPLTPRQREVLQLVVEGHSTKEIAHRLKISVKTVETHRAQIMDRLDIHNLASLVHYAIRAGILAPKR